jgi:hypothetical protein
MNLLHPAGRWRGDTEEERGRTGDEVHGADAVFVVYFLPKVAEPNVRCFLVTTMAERPW